MRATPTQDQLLTRLTMLSMMIGILFGVLLTLAILRIGGDVTFPYDLLIFGAVLLLGRRLGVVRRQLQTSGQPAKRTDEMMELGSLIFGIYLLIFGGVVLITDIFSLPVPGFVAALLIPGGFTFSGVLFAVLEGRRSRKEAQQQAIQEPAPGESDQLP